MMLLRKVQDMDIFYCVPLTLMVIWILYPSPMAKGASVGGGTMILISKITAFINGKIISSTLFPRYYLKYVYANEPGFEVILFVYPRTEIYYSI